MGGCHWRGAFAIFSLQLSRAFRTFFQSIFAPVLTTSLYFIVFGAAIGGQISQIGGVSYGAFIIPGLLLLTLLGIAIAARRKPRPPVTNGLTFPIKTAGPIPTDRAG